MAKQLEIHPQNPQPRGITQVVEALAKGGVIVYPTETSYGLGCQIGDKEAIKKIRRIRHLDRDHNFTLMCRDLSELAIYARVDNPSFRILKAHTPGPYTFIFEATKEVPKRLLHPKRNTIGIRVTSNPIARAILDALNGPMLSVTLWLPGDEFPVADVKEDFNKLDSLVDVIVDGGYSSMEPTTVVDLSQGTPKVVRVGKGDISDFQTG